MKRDVISRIKVVDVHNDKILGKQPLFSLHPWPGDNKQATIWTNWQAGSVASLSDMCAMLKAARNTPPGRYIYI